MKYLIDTNICIYIINKRPAGMINKFKQFKLGDVGISTITVSELQYGGENAVGRLQFMTKWNTKSNIF